MHLNISINSPEQNWLLQNENKCNVINQFLKTIDFEETGKAFIKSYIESSLHEAYSDLEDIIDFYYQVFNPELYNKPFDQQLWLAQTKNELSNPRAKMIDDLLNNHLKPGMSKDQILQMLGTPEFDGIQDRISIPLPDSLDVCKMPIKTKEESKQRIEDVKRWIKAAPRQPETLIMYPVGWKMVDPIYLEILFDGNGKARKFDVFQS